MGFGSAADRLSKMAPEHWILQCEFTFGVRAKVSFSLALAQCVFQWGVLLSLYEKMQISGFVKFFST